MSAQQAINKMCKECIYDEGAMGAGTWRQQVEDCTAPDCALFNYRPLTEPTRKKMLLKKIENMSPEELAKFKIKQERARTSFAKGSSSSDA